MTDPTPRGQADALRAAIDRTMSSLGEGSPASAAKLPVQLAASASRLVDKAARRGGEAGAEVVRRGGEAGAKLLDAVSDTLRRNSQRKVEGE